MENNYPDLTAEKRKGILAQLQDNTITYKKLDLKEMKRLLTGVLADRLPPKKPYLNTGLLGSHLLQWTMEFQMFDLPTYHTETYGKKYGIVQISVGKKHSLNKVIVDMREPEGFGKYSVRIGTIEVAKANSFISAVNHFKNHKDSQPDSKFEIWKREYGYYKRNNRR